MREVIGRDSIREIRTIVRIAFATREPFPDDGSARKAAFMKGGPDELAKLRKGVPHHLSPHKRPSSCLIQLSQLTLSSLSSPFGAEQTVRSLLIIAAAGAAAFAQTSFQIAPAVITSCSAAGLGRATLSWSTPGPGPVQVRVLSASGPPMTGFEPSRGSDITGDWVTDGTVFVLVDATGVELARTTARVVCNGPDSAISRALASDSYLPLTVGNTWVYRANNRAVTSTYFAWRVTGKEVDDGVTWYVLSMGDRAESGQPDPSDPRVRVDAAGRIFRRIVLGNGQVQESLWLDPTSNPSSAATLKIANRGPFTNPLGTFADAVYYTAFSGLDAETGAWVRGLGFASSTSNLLAGSSGGFDQSYDLVYANIDGHIVFAPGMPTLGLSAENTSFNVSAKQTANCAVPCYFVACDLVPTTDPAGTYKPCFEASLHIVDGRLSDSANGAQVSFDLLDSSGSTVVHQQDTLNPVSPVPDTTLIRQLALYTSPNVPLPLGSYLLRATVRFGTSGPAETATLPITLY